MIQNRVELGSVPAALLRVLFPSDYPELVERPNLRRVARLQLDPQFRDLRVLLRLPDYRDSPAADGIFATAQLLLGVISGASILFYEPDRSELCPRPGRASARFREMLREHYPWVDEDLPPNRAEAATFLWRQTRNTLAHGLGVGKSTHAFPGVADILPELRESVLLAKQPVDEPELTELLSNGTRPTWVRPTMTRDGEHHIIHLEALAWGTQVMLRKLFADPAHASRADELARHLMHAAVPAAAI